MDEPPRDPPSPSRGWLAPTDAFWRMLLSLPELALVPESCAGERHLHDTPRRRAYARDRRCRPGRSDRRRRSRQLRHLPRLSRRAARRRHARGALPRADAQRSSHRAAGLRRRDARGDRRASARSGDERRLRASRRTAPPSRAAHHAERWPRPGGRPREPRCPGCRERRRDRLAHAWRRRCGDAVLAGPERGQRRERGRRAPCPPLRLRPHPRGRERRRPRSGLHDDPHSARVSPRWPACSSAGWRTSSASRRRSGRCSGSTIRRGRGTSASMSTPARCSTTCTAAPSSRRRAGAACWRSSGSISQARPTCAPTSPASPSTSAWR